MSADSTGAGAAPTDNAKGQSGNMPAFSQGLFVTFEGIDGTGKTTQITRVAQALRDQGREAVTTFEPGGTALGGQIRHMLLSFKETATVLPRTEALLFAADRAEHVDEVIRPALAQGKIVLCDRYVDSSLAYQGAGRELTVDQVDWLSAWATRGLWPDRTYLFDMDPAAAHARVTGSRAGKVDRLDAESLDFQRRTREGYLRLADQDPKRYIILDASQPVDDITKKILDDLTSLLVEGPHPTVATRDDQPVADDTEASTGTAFVVAENMRVNIGEDGSPTAATDAHHPLANPHTAQDGAR